MKEKGFALPLVLVGVAVIAAIVGTVVYFKLKSKPVSLTQTGFSQTQTVSPPNIDETANWKVYSDSKNGFSIIYPPDWFTFPEPLSGHGFSDVKDIDPHDDYRYKIVVVNTYEGNDTFDASYSESLGSVTEQKTPDGLLFSKRTKVENLKIDGQPAIKFTEEGISPPSDPFLATIIWVKKDTVFKIQLLQPTKELHDKYKDTFDQMVRSFKFISK